MQVLHQQQCHWEILSAFFSLEKRRLQGDLIAAFQYLKWAYKQEGDWLFTWFDSDRTRGNGFNLNLSSFSLDVRKKFFTQKAMRPGTAAQRAVGAPSSAGVQGQAGRGPGLPELVGATSPQQELELCDV